MKFSIIGYGRFGKLWADLLSPHGDVFVYTRDPAASLSNKDLTFVTLNEAANADVVFITTQISKLEDICTQIRDILNPNAIVVDCCSVKIFPITIMQKALSKKQSIISTHPLFGPDTIKRYGNKIGLKIVVCPVQFTENTLNTMLTLFNNIGLKVLISTPEEHDRQMAMTQGLVHFIGRGLSGLGLQDHELSTPDYKDLLNINCMVTNDSWQLFKDMHKYNPYTKQVRDDFIKLLNLINDEVNNEKD